MTKEGRVRFLAAMFITLLVGISGLLIDGAIELTKDAEARHEKYKVHLNECIARETKEDMPPSEKLALEDLCSSEARRKIF